MDAQFERIQRYCEQMGFILRAVHFDEGITAKDVKGRVAYATMMSEMQEWDGVVVVKGDRIHRNPKNAMLMHEEFAAHGKKYYSILDGVDTRTSGGRFSQGILQLSDAKLIWDMQESIPRGMRQALAQTFRQSGVPFYGYDLVDGSFVLVPREAKWYKWAVRQTFGCASFRTASIRLEIRDSALSFGGPRYARRTIATETLTASLTLSPTIPSLMSVCWSR